MGRSLFGNSSGLLGRLLNRGGSSPQQHQFAMIKGPGSGGMINQARQQQAAAGLPPAMLVENAVKSVDNDLSGDYKTIQQHASNPSDAIKELTIQKTEAVCKMLQQQGVSADAMKPLIPTIAASVARRIDSHRRGKLEKDLPQSMEGELAGVSAAYIQQRLGIYSDGSPKISQFSPEQEKVAGIVRPALPATINQERFFSSLFSQVSQQGRITPDDAALRTAITNAIGQQIGGTTLRQDVTRLATQLTETVQDQRAAGIFLNKPLSQTVSESLSNITAATSNVQKVTAILNAYENVLKVNSELTKSYPELRAALLSGVAGALAKHAAIGNFGPEVLNKYTNYISLIQQRKYAELAELTGEDTPNGYEAAGNLLREEQGNLSPVAFAEYLLKKPYLPEEPDTPTGGISPVDLQKQQEALINTIVNTAIQNGTTTTNMAQATVEERNFVALRALDALKKFSNTESQMRDENFRAAVYNGVAAKLDAAMGLPANSTRALWQRYHDISDALDTEKFDDAAAKLMPPGTAADVLNAKAAQLQAMVAAEKAKGAQAKSGGEIAEVLLIQPSTPVVAAPVQPRNPDQELVSNQRFKDFVGNEIVRKIRSKGFSKDTGKLSEEEDKLLDQVYAWYRKTVEGKNVNDKFTFDEKKFQNPAEVDKMYKQLLEIQRKKEDYLIGFAKKALSETCKERSGGAVNIDFSIDDTFNDKYRPFLKAGYTFWFNGFPDGRKGIYLKISKDDGKKNIIKQYDVLDNPGTSLQEVVEQAIAETLNP